MLHHGSVSKALVACAAFAMILLIAPSAMAVTFLVNSNLDQPDDLTMPGTCHTAAGTCTLRAAVMQANLTSGAGATITLPAGTYTLTIPVSGGDEVEVGDLNLYSPPLGSPTIALVGAGASTTIIDANQLDRAFKVSFGRTATISGVTIKNGLSAVHGGGILNDGTLTLDGVVVHDNHTAALASSGGGVSSSATLTVRHSTFELNSGLSGGGINSGGSLTVSDSTFSQNTAVGDGGAIYGAGTATLTNSTINNNDAGGDGGGIRYLGNFTIANSTISQNNASNDGGGIYMEGGEANIYSSTISFNGADSDADGLGLGGGIYNHDDGPAATHLRNDLVAGNYISNSPTYRDCSGTVGTFGKNLFWDTTGCTLPQPAATWDLLGSLASLDSVLKNNGGLTKTHALLAGSNAIDGGDPTLGCIGPDSNPLPTDQRGFTRVGGVRCDIGAFELSDTIFADRFE